MLIGNIVGVIGVILCLVAFLLLQMGRLHATKPVYSWLNLFGALGIIYSLFFEFNLSSFLIEFSWVLISLLGLWRYYKARKAEASVRH